MNYINSLKAVRTARLVLALCVCISINLTATNSDNAAVANGLLKVLTPPPGSSDASSLLSSREVHIHLNSNPQPLPTAQPQPTVQQPVQRGFLAAFVIQNPITSLTIVSTTILAGTYFVRSMLQKRRMEASLLATQQQSQQNGEAIGQVQITLTEQGEQLRANGQTLTNIQTIQTQQGQLLTTQNAALTELQTGVGSLQAGQTQQGTLLTAQGQALGSLTSTVTDGFRTHALNQQKNEEASQAIKSDLTSLGQQQRTHAKNTENAFSKLFSEQQKEQELAAKRDAQTKLWQGSVEQRLSAMETGDEEQHRILDKLVVDHAILASTVTAQTQILAKVEAGQAEMSGRIGALSANAARCADGMDRALRRPSHQTTIINVGNPAVKPRKFKRVRIRPRKPIKQLTSSESNEKPSDPFNDEVD